MHGLFWVPVEPANLVSLVCHLDKKPILARLVGGWDEEEKARYNENIRYSLGEWAAPILEPTYKPTFIDQEIIKDGLATGVKLVQPLDHNSIQFFLCGWEISQVDTMIFSGDSDIKKMATKLANYFSWKSDIADYPRSVVKELSDCSHYVIFLHALFDLEDGVVIASRDDTLLKSMFDFLTSLGEPGFVYNGSLESQQRRLQMGNFGGLYIDEIPAGLAYWVDKL